MFAGCWDKDIWSWDRESRAPGRKYKGHSDFVKVVICAKVEGKDVRSIFPGYVPMLTSIGPHLCRRRLEDHGVGYSNWETLTYVAR